MAHHQLTATPETIHWGHFDASLPPVLRIRPGDTLSIGTVSGSREESERAGDKVLPEHRAIVEQCKPQMGPHILTGPIWIEGAEPGDTLEVQIREIELRQDWGYNSVRPLKGGLPDDFPLTRVMNIPIDRTNRTCTLPWGPTIPLRPFFGIMAVAPLAAYGRVSSVEPREYGGNIDNKELVAGSSLFLPVQVEGALFSAGDGHAVQGDGEVCLTALETAISGELTFRLHKAPKNTAATGDARVTGGTLRRPRAITPTHYISMAFDPDLDNAAREALRDMIAWLGELKGWSALDAYTTCSLACDLHITQIVDGNKGVHAMFPRTLID